MPDSKLVSLEGIRVLAQQTKSYVDRKISAAGSNTPPEIQTGNTVKTFSNDLKTVTTVYSDGRQLVKTFSDDMKTITSVLSDAEGNVVVTEIKTFSDDGLTVSTEVVYADQEAI